MEIEKEMIQGEADQEDKILEYMIEYQQRPFGNLKAHETLM